MAGEQVMTALSTSWKSKNATDGESLLDAMKRFDISGIELEYRITDVMFSQMHPRLKSTGLNIVSIHNYFPAPTHIKHLKPGGDMFQLSHPDKEHRQSAVDWTVRTIEYANDLEVPVVVLHCGYVTMDPEIHVLREFFDTDRIGSEEAENLIDAKQKELKNKKAPHIESLLFSLDRLITSAEKYGVSLGLENRYHYHELPGEEDFQTFFSEFRGGPIGYWHDTGHAHACEVLGMTVAAGLLEKYGSELLGMHLHDATGLDDHLPPGSGDISFEMLKPYLTPSMPMVLELKPGTSESDVVKGLGFLEELDLCAGIDSSEERNPEA